jgi:3-(3-hydroxy-phenyl)propionate hydroxylase
VYRFHARTCDRFSRGRVFLVGDAAHITPPFVGQGLVAGLRDAANLAWKLAWVVRGVAGERILDSYDAERRPHAKAMIDLARFMGHLIMPRSRLKAVLVHGTMRALRLLPACRRWFDDLRIKPKNEFATGLFVTRGRSARVLAGKWLPQGLVRRADGRIVMSDDVLGDRLALIGCGADATAFLDDATRLAWQAAGGSIARIEPRGGALHDATSCEDMSNVLVPGTAPVGWAVIARPDRTIMHDGPVGESARLVREALAMMSGGSAATSAVRPFADTLTLNPENRDPCCN